MRLEGPKLLLSMQVSISFNTAFIKGTSCCQGCEMADLKSQLDPTPKLSIAWSATHSPAHQPPCILRQGDIEITSKHKLEATAVQLSQMFHKTTQVINRAFKLIQRLPTVRQIDRYKANSINNNPSKARSPQSVVQDSRTQELGTMIPDWQPLW